MKKNQHIVNAERTGDLIRYAKTRQHKNILIKQWANEMRKAIRAGGRS